MFITPSFKKSLIVDQFQGNYLNMESLLSNFNRVLRVAFVFQTVGSIFLHVSNLASIVRQYVYGNTDSNTTMNVNAFTAEAQTLLYLTPDVVMSSARQFQQFHDFTLQNGLPMATILITQREDCRKCGKPLLIEKNSHPVIVYHTGRGTYLGSRFIKQCRRCQINEHYGYWTIKGQKYYDASTLHRPFLLSTEDTAFDITLLNECSNLLVVGAVPFSTFSSAYNRRFGYRSQHKVEEIPKQKRMKR